MRQAEHKTSPQAIRLLLIEDHEDLGAVTAEYLNAAGLEVRLARSGNEALKAAEVYLPDIVLCDLNLPDISGLDVAGALRQRPEMKGVLLALYSVLSHWEIKAFEREVQTAGVHMFLPKPLTDQGLQRLLAQYRVLKTQI